MISFRGLRHHVFLAIVTALGGLCLGFGILHLAVARLGHVRRHLWFGAVASLAAIAAWLHVEGYATADVGRYTVLMKWWITAEILCLLAFARFIHLYGGRNSPTLYRVATGGLLLSLVIHVASPNGILFSEILRLEPLPLPTGEELSLAVGEPGPLRLVGDLTLVLLLVYGFDVARRLYRAGRRRRARSVGLASGMVMAAMLWGSLVDLLIVKTPGAVPFALAGAAIIVGLDLARDAVRARQLERELTAGQRRWQQLLEGVDLLVVAVDPEGRIEYTNPKTLAIIGAEAGELAGAPVTDWLLPMPGEGVPEAGLETSVGLMDARLRVASGRPRIVHWSTVEVLDADGASVGRVSLGEDVSDRLHAQEARERAFAEIDRLRRELQAENIHLEELEEVQGFGGLIGESDALAYVVHKIRRVAGTDATVLIEGETGVGKELVARCIHDESDRAKRPFVSVNCAALAPSLIESELFGHERGAFTGADRSRKGRFELADGGTLFLDEVGDMPLEVQPKLLRALQEGEIVRLGGTQTIRVDVRLIAATNVELRSQVEAGQFREDLYYRLHVYPITVPPLRERDGDIPLLVRHFLREITEHRGIEITEIPASVMKSLEEYSWPGNVRELQNVLERAVLTSSDGVLRLPESLGTGDVRPLAAVGNGDEPHELLALDDLVREHIERVLAATGGQVAGKGGAAEILGVHPNTLRSRMKRLGVRVRRVVENGVDEAAGRAAV